MDAFRCFVDHVLGALRGLAREYTIAIVSATRGETIRKYVERMLFPSQSSLKTVPFVLGSDVPEYLREAGLDKAQRLLKLSALLGVPVERMAYIGDAPADASSAQRLQMPFVDARLTERQLFPNGMRFPNRIDYPSIRRYDRRLLQQIFSRINREREELKYAGRLYQTT